MSDDQSSIVTIPEIILNKHNMENIPQSLRNRRQWICWKYKPIKDKLTKIPIAPWIKGNLEAASATDPNNMTIFNEAVETILTHKREIGLGFAFFSGDKIVGIDIDKCVDLDTGIISEKAQEILTSFDSYAEFSPSGKGIHIIVFGTLLHSIKNTKEGVEAYKQDRYFTFTGEHVKGTPMKVRDAKDALNMFEQKYGKRKSQKKKPSIRREGFQNKYGWELEAIRNRDEKLDELLQGSTSFAGLPSASEADMAALTKLLFWEYSKGEAIDILRSFRTRPKLERDDYVTRTLENVSNSDTISKLVDPTHWHPSNTQSSPNTPPPSNANGPARFFQRDARGNLRFIPLLMVEELEKNFQFYATGQKGLLFYYDPQTGTWNEDGEEIARHTAAELLEDRARGAPIGDTLTVLKDRQYKGKTFPPPHPTKLVLKNGVLDLETFELEGYNPETYCQNQIPVKHDPNADNPKIKKYISEITPDVTTLQEWSGYHLVKNYKYAKAAMLEGKGRNGKGTYINLMTAFLGEDNVSHVSLEDIVEDKFARASLFGRLGNFAADIGRNELKRTQAFKWLTGGEKLEAQFKNKNRFKFRNYAKLTFSTNELPPTPDLTDAFMDRWLFFKFSNKFLGAKANTNLIDELTTEEELSGFLNWALEGYKRLVQQGEFTPTEAQANIRTTWEALSDPTSAFVINCCEVGDPNAFETKETTRSAYVMFCQEDGLIPASNRKFVEKLQAKLPMMRTKKITIEKKTTTTPEIRKNCWTSIRLKCDSPRISGGCQACQASQGSLILLHACIIGKRKGTTLDTVDIVDIKTEQGDQDEQSDKSSPFREKVLSLLGNSPDLTVSDIFQQLDPEREHLEEVQGVLAALKVEGLVKKRYDMMYRLVEAKEEES